MTKRTGFTSVVALLVGAFGIVFPPAAAAAAAAGPRPNIVLVMADDLGIEGLGCYGGQTYATPHLDRLAAGGLRFTHAYSQPLCTPTRVQLMTGRYNHRNWVCFGVLDPAARTFGHVLRGAGYRTCMAGKWQLQSYDPPDFPGAAGRRGTGMAVGDAGFDEYSLFHAGHTEDKGSRYADPTVYRNGELHREQAGRYGPDTSVDFILDFIRRRPREGEPFFVYYPMSLPHWPMVPTPDSAAWADPARRLEGDTAYFPDMVAYMDKLVGRLVEGIAAVGLAGRTLILFYSDNGTDRRITSRLGGEDFRGGKATPLQTGIRVPLIASWPGTIAPGRSCADLVDASDFFPTLAELAGVELPAADRGDGVSFAPRLLGREGGAARDSCFFWYDPRPGWDKERFFRHIFALDHSYKLFADGRLFDIAGEGFREVPVDPGDLTPEARAARAKLRAAIDRALRPPLAPAATREVDAFGQPVE